MQRFAERSLALLVTAALTQSGCYYWSGRVVETGSRVQLTPSRPIHIASKVEVHRSGNELQVMKIPMCSDSQVGTYTIHSEKRASRRAPRIVHLILGVGVGSLALWLATKGDDWGIPTAIVVQWTLTGAFFVPFGVVGVALPNTWRTKQPDKTYSLAALEQAEGWTKCGDPEHSSAPMRIKFKGPGGEYSTETWAATFPLSQELDAWASSCGGKVTVTVDVTGDGISDSSSAALNKRESEANIESDAGSSHTASSIRSSNSDVATAHLELGDRAGKVDPPTYSPSLWNFEVSPRPNVYPPSSGGSEAANFARACRAKEKADAEATRLAARERCIAPKKSATEAECRKSCTDTKKQAECDVKHEICIGDTQGISGTIQEGCDDDRSTCLYGYNQDAGSINRCTDSCAQAAYTRLCGAP